RLFAESSRVTGVPIQHERAGGHTAENLGRFRAGSGVAGSLVLENQDKAKSADFFGLLLQPSVEALPIRNLVIESPEVETANAIGGESLGQRNGAVEDFALLLVSEARVELIVLRAEF